MSSLGTQAAWRDRSEDESYLALLDSLPFLAWLTDERGNCKFQNAAFLEFLGRSRVDLLDAGWTEYVHPDDVGRCAALHATSSDVPPRQQIEMRMRDSCGSYRWFLSTLIPEKDRLGHFIGYFGYSVDITEFKAAAESLYRSETRYRRLFDSNLIGVTYTNVKGWILDANEKFLEMLGYSAEDVQSNRLRWIDITPPEYKSQAQANMSELEATGAFKPIEKQYIRKDGSKAPVLVASAFLEGSRTDCVTFVVDLTEQKRAEQEMREQAEALAKGQISALNRTLGLLATEPSLDTALSYVLKAITEQLNVTSSGLHLVDLHSNSTILHMNYHEGQITRGSDNSSTVNARHIARMTEKWRRQEGECKQPVVLDVATSAELDEAGRRQMLANGIQTLLLVPLMVHNKLVGTLSIRLRERRTLRLAEIELTQALAQQASLAVQLTHLAERSRQVAVLEERSLASSGRVAELARANQALKQTLDILATEPEMNEVLGHVLTVITQVLEGSISTLWLRDRDAETAKLHLVYREGCLVGGNESGHRLAGQTLDLSRQDLFALAVFRRGRPVWHEVETSEALDETAKKYLREQNVIALLGIPLILGEKTIGSIVVRFSQLRQFGSIEMEMAQGLAQQATLAFQLTRLAEQARKAAITEERNRMAREIHDTLAQGFTGILIQLQAATQVLNGAHPDIRRHVDAATALARVGLAEARRSVQGLRPQLLRDGNISTALDHLVKQLSGESLVRISFSSTGDPRSMSSEIESNLLRICQEAITNAMKHSGGTQINVRLALEPEAVHLAVEDNGAGFDPHVSTWSRGYGLISMQERADRIGGELTILTKPNAGTKVHLLLPIAQSKSAGAGNS